MSDRADEMAQKFVPENATKIMVDTASGARRRYSAGEWREQIVAALRAYAEEKTDALAVAFAGQLIEVAEEARREERELVRLLKIMSQKAEWPEVLWYDGYLCRSDAMQFGELLAAIRAREEGRG